MIQIITLCLPLWIAYRSQASSSKPLAIWKKIFYLLLLAAVWYYVFYPPINIHSLSSWIFINMLLIEAFLLFAKPLREYFDIESSNANGKTVSVRIHPRNPGEKKRKNPFKGLLALIALEVIVWVGAPLIFSPLFMASTYAKRITVTSVDFSEIPSFNFNQTAIIDRDSSSRLGDKVMGEMTDLVSQFSVSSEYSQISYRGGTWRVTPLAYDGFIKYLKNRNQGIPGYIMVNTTSGSTSLTRLTNKMHYVPSGYFNENIYRQLRFQYPTKIFGNPSFEIDEEGNPYYVCTTYTWSGLHSIRRVEGVVLFNPITAASQYYDVTEAPTWIDRIFPESLVTTELNDYGQYQKGFLNSMIGQEGVIQTSEGYNYIAKDGDIWLYTGMTSAVSDESNVGFMLVNLRTHEGQYTSTSGASEYATMASAEGEVLNYGYTATFPTLINVNGKPVYLLSLKDSAGLIKMYAMVDAQDYQQVYTVKSDKNTEAAISELIRQISGEKGTELVGSEEKTIIITAVRTAVIDGNTILYFMDEQNTIYRLTLTESNAGEALFLQEGDRVTITIAEADGEKHIIDLAKK